MGSFSNLIQKVFSKVDNQKNYREEFQRAVLRSRKLNVFEKTVHYSDKTYITEEVREDLNNLYGDYLIHQPPMQCIKTNFDLMKSIQDYFGIELYLTIGYIFIKDKTYFEISEQDIQSLLSSIEIKKEVKLHVWLTLPSMEIIDVTIITNVDFINNLVPPRVGIMAGYPSEINKNFVFHPMIVGRDFLHQIGASQIRNIS